MNKSFSKIRHIQESNKMLEKRLLESEETELRPIDDEYTLGTAIVQCYNDSRSGEETEKLIESKGNSNKAKRLIEKIKKLFGQRSDFGDNPKKLGEMYFNDKSFVRSIQEICKKYKIPYMPRA